MKVSHFSPPKVILNAPILFGSKKISTGPQLSEYVHVVCRNTNGTCLKSVSKTPRFFWDFQLFQHPGKLAKFRPNLGQFWPKRAIFQIYLKNQSRNIFGLQRLGFLQKIMKFQCAVFEKNAKNPHFWVFWAKKANFGPFFAKKGPFSNFRWKIENVTFYSFFHFAIQKIRKF